MKPYYIEQSTKDASEWIDLDHVLAVSEIQTEYTSYNYKQYKFRVTLAFRNDVKTFFTGGEDNNHKYYYSFLKAWKEKDY